MSLTNGEDKNHSFDSADINLKLKTLEGKIDENTNKVVEKFTELIAEIKLLREGLLSSATNHDTRLIEVVMPVFRTICWLLGALVIWFTGIKSILPEIVGKN